MQVLKARDLLNIPLNQIFNVFTEGKYNILFENDEVVELSSKTILLNRYMWELFRSQPNVPIVPSISVNNIIKGNYYNSDTHIKVLETIFKYIVSYNNFITFEQKEALLEQVYFIVNLIFNDLLYRVSNSVTTIDAIDFIDVINLPSIKTIHENIQPNPDSVDKAYKDIKQTLTSIEQSNNRFIHAYKSKSVNENQSNQCIGPRGFVTDIDRTVFNKPILNGFIQGLDTLFEFIAESRTAAKALNANDKQIRDSEYTSRRLQLLSMVVENVESTDCGSTEYFNICVTPSILENLKGKYYLNEELHKLERIKGDETHLLNKFIKIRTALGCKLPNRKNICSTCLGEISNNFKANSNLGYTAVSYLMEKATQSILSTKHLTHSVRKSTISLSGNACKYFYVNQEGYIYLNKNLNTEHLRMTLLSNQVSKLTDVLNLLHTQISLSKIGEITEVAMTDVNHKFPITELVDLQFKDRIYILTKSFLEYIKITSFETDSKGNFIISLKNIDKEQPIFFSPLKEKNIGLFVKNLASIIEKSDVNTSNPYTKLDEAFSHVIDQFKCNISIIEVIVYATTVFNNVNKDFRLGRNSPHIKSESQLNISTNRSISQLFVYESQTKTMFENGFQIFSNEYKEKHPFDVLFIPNEILNNK